MIITKRIGCDALSMGTNTTDISVQREAVNQLEASLAAQEQSEKDFHLRQALQLLNVTDTEITHER